MTGSAQFGTAGLMTYHQVVYVPNISFSARYNGSIEPPRFLSLVELPVIDSMQRDGKLSFSGVATSTVASVEWAASLAEPGRTNGVSAP
ncbi:MAG TPA: hypothetical protein P5567_02510 [Kiritimatiellia bacterium]|nr:hypothetical protein [Kiritimatiellia bacterium]HRZ11304.1 hypothetical protein [Kiritimatiellia bacterium]HSA17145.1 hypothetical protein [Kiritimatiellia bacterium]